VRQGVLRDRVYVCQAGIGCEGAGFFAIVQIGHDCAFTKGPKPSSKLNQSQLSNRLDKASEPSHRYRSNQSVAELASRQAANSTATSVAVVISSA